MSSGNHLPSRCQTPPTASPDHIEVPPVPGTALVRKDVPAVPPKPVVSSHPPRRDHPAFSQAQPRVPKSRPGQGPVGSLGQAGPASPLLRIPTWCRGRGRGVWPIKGPLCQGLGCWGRASPLEVFLHLSLAKGSRYSLGGLIPDSSPSFSAPTCPTGSQQGPCLPSSSWPLTPTHPHPCWQGQGPRGIGSAVWEPQKV